ncbi:hypothetical protein GOHSU_16_01130 [Gordonia hirsuta DSM 44140 = NBRC 16056]|uniref:HNH nuclease domain-containing protein n=1 Tax=Gordonia hirsuta DSM 44140 = NBRC 16056 TaxID=1121927 RepID=L7L7M4_9ACTN|nr:HNH endonuclease signature motif containing protein [Gordonia hirsuta]GAC57155.1 hypothetical protein GOHSU_16_01130 [Gordonia hirsuta DSM 44140 = NBRC 16056]
MDASTLTELADRMADDLTDRPGDERTLAAFLTSARPVDDDRELLALTASLLRIRTITDHALARTADVIARVGLPGRKRVRSASSLLAALGAAPAVAHRAVRLGTATNEPAAGPVTRGMRDGAVSAELGDAVVRGLHHVTGRVELTDEAKARLVTSLLVQTTPSRVKDKARSFAIALAPAADQAGEDAVPIAERDDLNDVEVVRTDDGRVQVTMDLDVVAGEQLYAALDPLTRPRPEPDGSEDTRSVGRRRADGFTQLVRTYLSRSDRPESGGVLPHVTLLVPATVSINGRQIDGPVPADAGQSVEVPLADLERLAGQVPSLGFTGPISARTTELIMCDVAVALALLDKEGVPLDVHDEHRLFPPGLRKALAIRDGGCAFPGCGLPPSWCDAHHVEHWQHGGKTCLDNGVLLCRRHHTLIHHGGWEVFIGHDRHPWFIPPADPDHPDRRREPMCADNRRTLTSLPTAA